MSFASWLHERAQRRENRHWARYMYETALKSKYKPNGKSVEIIGIPSAVFTHITTDATPGSLTQTTFDTDSRADSAQILLTNSTGASKVIIAAWIRGKPVTRYSDSSKPVNTIYNSILRGGDGSGGFLHDKFVDYESIAKNGERVFETGNNFVVTADQVNQLADYYWKLNKTKKHIYTLSLVGFQSWYEPGEWYTLQIGGAGQEEYIDSTVECFDVRCSLAAGGAPSTSVAFREVEEAWKFDSNEVARQIAAGDFSRRTSQNVVMVAAQYYPGYADYYCDGTDDQSEINSAITYMSQSGGGTVRLTNGEFYLTSAITMLDDIALNGSGAGTTLVENANDIASVYASSVSNIDVVDLSFDTASSITNATEYTVHFLGIESGRIVGNRLFSPWGGGILCDNCDTSYVINNVVDYQGSTSTAACYGIYLLHASTSLGNIIHGNIVQNVRTSDQGIGILVQNSGNRFDCDVVNNKVSNIIGTASGLTSYGINVLGNNVNISSNRVTGCRNVATTSKTVGIKITTASTNCSVANNYAYDNGADTGLANTNSQNFLDGGTDTHYAG